MRLKKGKASVDTMNHEFGETDPGARAKGFRAILEKFASKVNNLIMT